MNRKLLVSLLRKSIEELEMITDGFMEMDEYPSVILNLAKRKNEDINAILEQLQVIKISNMNVSPIVAETLPKVVQEIENTAAQKTFETATEISTENLLAPQDEDRKKSENDEIIQLDETIELLDEIEITDIYDVKDTGMKTIELDDLEENSEEPIIVEKYEPSPATSPSPTPTPTPTPIPPKVKKESRVEELLIKTTSEESKVVTIADKIAPSKISRSEKLSQADNSLSASIANKKIDDIKQAISIGDRFRFQRELFAGNGEEMNKTLNYINQLASVDEVVSFLQNKFKWNEEDNDVVDFMQIVKRRFI